MVADDPTCVCGDPQSRHKGGANGCRNCEIGCARFERDEEAQLATGGIVTGPPITIPASGCVIEPSTSARLREVERELVQLTAQLAEARAEAAGAARLLERIEQAAGAESLDPFTDLAEYVGAVCAGRDKAVRERDSLGRRLAVRFEEKTKAEEARDIVQAKLDSALLKMAEQVDARNARIAELAALLEHAEQYARDLQTNGDVAPVEIHGWDAWQCFTCGSRYRRNFQHECGPLKPVRVSIHER